MGTVLEPAASEFIGKVSVVYVDGTKFSKFALAVGLKEEFPAISIKNVPPHELNYPFSQKEKITEKSFRQYLEKFTSGKMEPTLRSEPIPTKNDDPVKIVVGDEFEDIVYDKSRDVFVEFYAPWCGHCKKLTPIWDELGSKFAGNKKLTIAKMDATANDLPINAGFKVDGFPKMVLFKAGTNERVPYDGERDLESMVAFLREQATYNLGPEQETSAKKEEL